MELLEYGDKMSDLVLIRPADKHDLENIDREVELIKAYAGKEFRLMAFRVGDWNRDLSPWKAPAVFGGADFGEGAQAFLDEILRHCTDSSKTYCIGGYSLAALFALWASYKTDIFKGVAAASPSMWFPGFEGFMRDHETKSRFIYLSLGDKEEKARNPVLATVGDRMRSAYDLLKMQGTDCVLEWNEGNHFKDAGIRTAKAFASVIKQDL